MKRVFNWASIICVICFFGQAGMLETGALTMGQAIVRMFLTAIGALLFVVLADAQKKPLISGRGN